MTSEIGLPDQQIYDTCHNLWPLEAFRIMKSDLDARPVFLRKKETIQDHFLICYLTVLLERFFQTKILKNWFSASEIFEFFRKFRVAKVDRKYLRLATDTDLTEYLSEMFGLPQTNYFLAESQIHAILNCKI